MQFFGLMPFYKKTILQFTAVPLKADWYLCILLLIVPTEVFVFFRFEIIALRLGINPFANHEYRKNSICTTYVIYTRIRTKEMYWQVSRRLSSQKLHLPWTLQCDELCSTYRQGKSSWHRIMPYRFFLSALSFGHEDSSS